MAITTLDTHEAIKDLTAAGFTEPQAEAVTRWVRKSQDVDLSDFATKSDIAMVRADLKTGLAETKAEILKWMVGTIGIQTVVILGAVVSLVRIMAH